MKTLRILLKQFPFLAAIRLYTAHLVLRLLDPMRLTSYSQAGEDHIISFHLPGRMPQDIFYVDIGCYMPIRFSNTAALYKRGARGFVVDGCPEHIEKYKKVRPRDKAVCACVSNSVAEMDFVTPDRASMSTLSSDFADKYLSSHKNVTRRKVRTVTAQQLFESHGVPKNFDLLTIDVEGHDFEVLQSFDLNVYRPSLIVIEMLGLDLSRGSQNHPVCQYLENHGYRFIAYAAMNGYFRLSEK